MNGDGIISGTVTDGSAVFGHFTVLYVVADFTTDNETIRSIFVSRKVYRYNWKRVNIPNSAISNNQWTLENIHTGVGEQVVLFVFSANFGILAAGSGQERAVNRQFQTLDKRVCQFNLGVQYIAGGPGLRDS
jgi:hypothetical protein